MKKRDGQYRQRIGKLVEAYICKKYNFKFNKRQQTHGYYDCYNDKFIYEIKGSKNTSGRYFINSDNHKLLKDVGGIYCFVNYELINKDKELTVITDINILEIKFIEAKKIDDLIIHSKKEYFNKYVDKKYYRISRKDIFNHNDDIKIY